MPRYGITLGYQKDKCSICKFVKELRLIFDTEAHKIVKICDKCVQDQGGKSIEEILKKYGKKTSKKQIEILSKEEMEKKGFEITGKKDISV